MYEAIEVVFVSQSCTLFLRCKSCNTPSKNNFHPVSIWVQSERESFHGAIVRFLVSCVDRGWARARQWLVEVRCDLEERDASGDQGVTKLVHIIHQETYVAHVVNTIGCVFFRVVSSYARQDHQCLQLNTTQDNEWSWPITTSQRCISPMCPKPMSSALPLWYAGPSTNSVPWL